MDYYRHERASISRKLFFEAPLEPSMKIKSDPAMLSIVFVLFRATVSQTALANFSKLAPRMNMKNTSCVMPHFVEFINT